VKVLFLLTGISQGGVMEEESKDSRRGALKKIGKTASFVVPLMVSFNMNTLAVPASTGSGAGKVSIRAEFPD